MAKKKKGISLSIADKVLKSKKDPELQKQLQSEIMDYEVGDEPEQESEQDQYQDVVEQSALHRRAIKKRKDVFRNALIIAAFAPVIFFVHWLFKPFEADMRFGFCRVFLEQNVQYPDRLILSTVEERRDFVRIWYMQTDAFGQERLENIECHHGYSDARGYFIEKVEINRQEVDPDLVERFNVSLNTIIAHPPDLTYPARIRDALGNINIQTYLFRKPIF